MRRNAGARSGRGRGCGCPSLPGQKKQKHSTYTHDCMRLYAIVYDCIRSRAMRVLYLNALLCLVICDDPDGTIEAATPAVNTHSSPTRSGMRKKAEAVHYIDLHARAQSATLRRRESLFSRSRSRSRSPRGDGGGDGRRQREGGAGREMDRRGDDGRDGSERRRDPRDSAPPPL